MKEKGRRREKEEGRKKEEEKKERKKKEEEGRKKRREAAQDRTEAERIRTVGKRDDTPFLSFFPPLDESSNKNQERRIVLIY